jgi:hypothetical protein
VLFDEVAEMLAEFDRFCEPYDNRHTQALQAIHASTCWRLTAPFRFVKTLAAGRRRRRLEGLFPAVAKSLS